MFSDYKVIWIQMHLDVKMQLQVFLLLEWSHKTVYQLDPYVPSVQPWSWSISCPTHTDSTNKQIYSRKALN